VYTRCLASGQQRPHAEEVSGASGSWCVG
jgi:hypothetical protein